MADYFQELRILLVEDNPVDRLAAIRALRNWPNDIAITEADSNAAALAALQNQAFDVILLDFTLPDGDGLEFLTSYRRQADASAAIVVISGTDDLAMIERVFQAGAHDFILKDEISPRYLVRGLVMARQRARVVQASNQEKDRLQLLATHDELSGVYNRRFFQLTLAAALQRSDRLGDGVAILLIDLDGFKPVNDSWGHQAGDQVLVEVARRLTMVTRKGDYACRLGGDEFAIILHHVTAETNLQAIARRYLGAFDAPVNVGEQTLRVGMSGGLALGINGFMPGDQLIHNADTALYQAKRAGKNRVQVFGGPEYFVEARP